jgi:hypothetical protein
VILGHGSRHHVALASKRAVADAVLDAVVALRAERLAAQGAERLAAERGMPDPSLTDQQQR